MVVANLFCTITNANFDDDMLAERVRNTCAAKKALMAELASRDGLADAALWEATDKEAMLARPPLWTVAPPATTSCARCVGSSPLASKGAAKHAKHADVLGKHDPEVDGFLQEALAKTLDDNLTVADLVEPDP